MVISSLVIVRRRLRYETWYFVHLYTYLAIALAFSHQIATGREFVGDPAARLYWQGLYVATLAAVLVFRFGLPLARNLAPSPARRARDPGGARVSSRWRSAARSSGGCGRPRASSSRGAS